MLFARGTPRAILAGAFAAALIVAALLSFRPAPAIDGVDGIDGLVTGAIGPAPVPVAAPVVLQALPPRLAGSDGFKAALALLDEEKYAAAYAAAQSLGALERHTVEWTAIFLGQGEIAPADVKAFGQDADGFAPASILRSRLEQALLKTDASGSDVMAYLGGTMPGSLEARIALATAYLEDGERQRATAIARTIWIEDFLDAASEAKVLAALGPLLTADDHWARAEHLMMHDRASGVERLFKFMTPAQKSLAVARNAVSRHAADAKQLLDAVDPAYRDNAAYIFSRAQRARQFELWDDAIAWLDKGPSSGQNAAEWWYERQGLVRELLSKGDAKRAYTVAAGYTAGPEGRLVEAHFHAGWIALSFLGEPAIAARQFAAMAKLSTLATSVTQANYWLGRARSATGDAGGATAAYTVAAQYGTVYYGLLARAALGLPAVELRQMPTWKDDEQTFESREVVRAIRLLIADGRRDVAAPLLRNLAQSLQSGGEFVLAARLAQQIDAHQLAISIADIADKRGAPLDLFSFPKDGLPDTHLAEIDKAAIYAVTRTESRFQANAVSSAGAQGLMQLMPSTARETAERLGVAYSEARLATDAAYNAQLGSSYLATQLKTYDGSLVLAAAAYNAGAGNANKWIAAFGDPRAANVDAVVWVELIPFQETRKYVQRVLGNYLVYRARLGLAPMDPVAAMRSIAG
jgi:soluble lytic murein transglycosylase